MIRIILWIGLNFGPSELDLVIETNSVKKFMATIEVNRCVCNLTDFEQLIDADINWSAINVQQMCFHIEILFWLLFLDAHEKAIKDWGLLVLQNSFSELILIWITLFLIVAHEEKRRDCWYGNDRDSHLRRIIVQTLNHSLRHIFLIINYNCIFE